MTVLVLSELFPNPENPSAGIFVLDQMRALRRQGVDFHVIAPVPWIPPFQRTRQKWQQYARIPASDVVEGFPVTYMRFPMLPKGWLFWLTGVLYYLSCRRAVGAFIRRHNISLIHAHTIMPMGFTAVLLGREFKVPVACTVHGSDVNIQPFTNWRNRWAARWALKRVPHLFAVSHDLKRKIVKLGGERRVDVVRNGADVHLFHPIPQADARDQLGLPLDRKIVLFVGNLLPVKNPALLLAAFAKLSAPDPLLYVLGDGWLKGELQAKAAALGIQERCMFIGRRPHGEIGVWLAAADCLALTSNMEGLPTVLPEAMLCRTTIVATRVGGMPEILVHEETGLLVSPESAGEVAEAIDRILCDHDLRSRLTENAAQLANQELTWDANASQVLHAYQELLHATFPAAEAAWKRAGSRA